MVDLDEPAGPTGSTVRHLLSHASGLAVDTDRVLAPLDRRRVYSNRGFDLLGELLERRTGTAFGRLLHERVAQPLSMTATVLEGGPAHGARGPVTDLARLGHELLVPRHFPATLVDAARTTVFPDLRGVLPGFGRQEPNDWGLGFEVRGHKEPHWMSPQNSPSSFGHFGQSGAFLWVDPVARMAVVAVSDTPFRCLGGVGLAEAVHAAADAPPDDHVLRAQHALPQWAGLMSGGRATSAVLSTRHAVAALTECLATSSVDRRMWPLTRVDRRWRLR